MPEQVKKGMAFDYVRSTASDFYAQLPPHPESEIAYQENAVETAKPDQDQFYTPRHSQHEQIFGAAGDYSAWAAEGANSPPESTFAEADAPYLPATLKSDAGYGPLADSGGSVRPVPTEAASQRSTAADEPTPSAALAAQNYTSHEGFSQGIPSAASGAFDSIDSTSASQSLVASSNSAAPESQHWQGAAASVHCISAAEARVSTYEYHYNYSEGIDADHSGDVSNGLDGDLGGANEAYVGAPGIEIRREAQRVAPLDFRRSLESDSASTASTPRDARDSPPLLDVLPTPSSQETSRFSGSAQSTLSLDSAPYTLENLRGSSESIDARKRPRSFARHSYYDFGSLGNLAIPEPQAGAASILPRMKTIDLYRRNARKSNDAELEFQLAQYVMQTALAANVNVTGAGGSTPPPSRSSSNLGTSLTGSSASSDELRTPELGAVSGPGSPGAPFHETAADQKIIRGMFKEAVQSLRYLAERGHADSQYLLGDLYASRALGKPDMERSFRYFLMAAKHGHAESAYRTALCLQEGWGTPRGASRALQFYKSAAFKNQPGALYQMGMLFFHGGMGIEDNVPNRLQGVKWLTRAAKVANSVYNRAPHELAKIYEVGYKDLVFQDAPYAARLYAKSAELGHIPSAGRLGRAYEFGELACPQDPALSIHYYTQAALGNDPNAQLSLCAWYMVGAGQSFPVNHPEAYEWALRAALNGLPKAQFTAGFFLEQGIGVHKDIVEATKWYKRAADGGYEKAVDKLRGLGALDSSSKKQKCILM